MFNIQLSSVLLFIFSFFAIWIGSGLIVDAIHGVSAKLRLSSFMLSFFVLGLLTSIPELAVGMTAILRGNPEIFVGNLLGGIPVLFLFAIPLLAVFGNGIRLAHKLSREVLLVILTVIATPAALMLDNRVTTLEACALILLYVLLFLFIEHKQPVAARQSLHMKSHILLDLGMLIFGVSIVFFSSQYIVQQTLSLAQVFQLSPFIISLIIVSLGTNLPELALGLRSVFSGDNDIALGDYLGSAAANVIFFGGLTLINGGTVEAISNVVIIFLFIITGMALFYIFAKSNKGISRIEGAFLLLLFVLFALLQFIWI